MFLLRPGDLGSRRPCEAWLRHDAGMTLWVGWPRLLFPKSIQADDLCAAIVLARRVVSGRPLPAVVAITSSALGSSETAQKNRARLRARP